MHGKKTNPKSLSLEQVPLRKTEGNVGRPAITRELNGIPMVYCVSLALSFLRFDRTLYLSPSTTRSYHKSYICCPCLW